MEERENQSSLYITPEDRVERVEEKVETPIPEEEIKDAINFNSGKKDEIASKDSKNIRRVILFLIVSILNICLFGYIIYLVVTIFASL